MDDDCMLNITTTAHKSESKPKICMVTCPKIAVTLPKDTLNKISLIKSRAIKISRKVSENKYAVPIQPKTKTIVVAKDDKSNSTEISKDLDDDVHIDRLKFEYTEPEIVSNNPLQVGLSAKQHSTQQDLLNLVSEHINPNIEPLFSDISWSDYAAEIKLHPHLLAVLIKQFNFKTPTAIQVSAIRHLIEGRDALIKAQTGSGKTFSYALPMMQHLMSSLPHITRSDGPKALILLPTRELATQTKEVLTQLCRACVRVVPGCLIGGTKRKAEKASIRKGLNIIVSTPQRLLDHLVKTAILSLKGLQWLVIDEADRLVELGFERDVRQIITRATSETFIEGCDSPIQTVLLSATLTPGVENLAGLALKNPVTVEVSEPQITPQISAERNTEGEIVTNSVAKFSLPAGLKHFILIVPCKLRLVTLAAFLLLKSRYSKRSGKLIVFFATQDCVDFHYRLFTETICDKNSEIKANNLSLFRLHGNMDHKERYPVFQAFSKSPNGVLLTTDVASRGLDLAGVAWVVQYHVSGTPVDYVHRVGRTARAGGRGKALLFLQPEEETYVDTLASTVGIHLEKLQLTDVLQTALYHLQNGTEGHHSKRPVNTVEEAAACLSKQFLQTVTEESELTGLAEKAYLSFLRAYASFSGQMRVHFTFQRLHLGHVARAFCLQATPRDIAAQVTGRRLPNHFGKRDSNSKPTTDAPVNKSRRLEFEDEKTRMPPRKAKQKPSELANRNMLAEYGL